MNMARALRLGVARRCGSTRPRATPTPTPTPIPTPTPNQVWLDEAESLVGGGARFRNLGDLEARRALRRRLDCRPFRWHVARFDHQYLDPPTGSLPHELTNSLPHLLTTSLPHYLARSPTHSLTHSLTYCLLLLLTAYCLLLTAYYSRYLENVFPDHDPLPVGFRWAAPPQRELAAVTGSAAPRETSESQRGAGVGETDRDEPRRRLGNGTLPLQAAYSHVPIRIRSGAPDILTIL